MATRKIKFIPGEKFGMTLKRESCVVGIVRDSGAFRKEGVEPGWTILRVDGNKVDPSNVRAVLKDAMTSGKKEFKIRFEITEPLNRHITFKPGVKLGFWLIDNTCVLDKLRDDGAGAANGVKPGWTILKVDKTSVNPGTVKGALKRCSRLRREFSILFKMAPPPKMSLMNKFLGSKTSNNEHKLKPAQSEKLGRKRSETVPAQQRRKKGNLALHANESTPVKLVRKQTPLQKLGLVFSKNSDDIDEAKQPKSPKVNRTTDKLRRELKVLKSENEEYKRRNKNLEVAVLGASDSLEKHQDTYLSLKEKKAEVTKLRKEVENLKQKNKDSELAKKSLEATLAANMSLRKEIESMKRSHTDALTAKEAKLKGLRYEISSVKTDRATLKQLLNETLKKQNESKKERSLSPPPALPVRSPITRATRAATLPWSYSSGSSEDNSLLWKKNPSSIVSPSLQATSNTIRENPLPSISVHEAENGVLKREMKILRTRLKKYENEKRELEATFEEKSSKREQEHFPSSELRETIRKLLLVQEEISRAVESGDISKAKYVIKKNKGYRNIG